MQAMSACEVVREMQQTSSGGYYGDLEDYLSEVEKRSRNRVDADDVYGQLAQREKDLVLAAELGKALLEKNEEISRANERLAEEYSHKLELLEQEKHGLRRKLDVLEGECESRVAELQGDLSQMRKDLAQQHTLHRTTDKEKSQLLEELTEQNHRLTAELKQSARAEDQLQSQLQSLREQFNVRRSNLHDHVSQLEGLREEIDLLSERKNELERRISALSDEREDLNMSLEESSDKILLLERRNREQEQQLRVQQRDVDQLRQANGNLQNRLDAVLRRSSTPTLGQTPSSLFNEIEMSSVEDELRSLTAMQMKTSSQHGSSIGFSGDLVNDDEIECDDLALPFPGNDEEDSWKVQQELVPIYHQLRRLCAELRRRGEDGGGQADSGVPPSPEDIHLHQVRVGMLGQVAKELRGLVEEVLAEIDDKPCLTCQSIAEERDAVEKLQKEVNETNEQLKKKSEEISQLTTKLTLQETELASMRESRDQLQHDMDNSALAKDQVVKKAWEVRDQAVARKNAVEIELARTRIDVMHINSQLMEAVQQKVELCQQLEQWQLDMEILLDKQVMKKLKTQEQEDKKRQKSPNSHPQPPPTKRQASKSKLFGLWR